MIDLIDARGYSCPTPVLLTQRAVKAGRPAALQVLVSARAALENVTRFAEGQGYRVQAEAQDGDYLLTLYKA